MSIEFDEPVYKPSRSSEQASLVNAPAKDEQGSQAALIVVALLAICVAIGLVVFAFPKEQPVEVPRDVSSGV